MALKIIPLYYYSIHFFCIFGALIKKNIQKCMNKQKGLLIGGSVIIVIAGGIMAYSAFTRGRGKNETATASAQIFRPESQPATDISVDEATALMAEATGENPLYDLYRFYNDNNMVFLDKEAPCNKGTEALQAFVEQFSRDSQFQANRTKISEGGMRPDFSSLSLVIAEPDSTNFFGAWSNIAPNEASFCHGWLGSEMLEEYTFTRKDSASHWVLTDYFSALAELD